MIKSITFVNEFMGRYYIMMLLWLDKDRSLNNWLLRILVVDVVIKWLEWMLKLVVDELIIEILFCSLELGRVVF